MFSYYNLAATFLSSSPRNRRRLMGRMNGEFVAVEPHCTVQICNQSGAMVQPDGTQAGHMPPWRDLGTQIKLFVVRKHESSKKKRRLPGKNEDAGCNGQRRGAGIQDKLAKYTFRISLLFYRPQHSVRVTNEWKIGIQVELLGILSIVLWNRCRFNTFHEDTWTS